MMKEILIQGPSDLTYGSIKQALGGNEGVGERFIFTCHDKPVDFMEGGIEGQIRQRVLKEKTHGDKITHHITRGDYPNHLAKELSRVSEASELRQDVEEIRDTFAHAPSMRDRVFNNYLGVIASDLENLSSTSFEAQGNGIFHGQTTLTLDSASEYPRSVARNSRHKMAQLKSPMKEKIMTLEGKLDAMEAVGIQRMLGNYLETGAMVASPSQRDPNYYFCWRRDAALTTRTVVDQYRKSGSRNLSRIIDGYVKFSGDIQKSGVLADAKYNVYGYPTYLPWGNPQNDGPGFNAAVFSDYAEILLGRGEKGRVLSDVYPVIKKDLDYLTSDEGRRSHSHDVWEEVDADHFFTDVARIVGLSRGSRLAGTLGLTEDAARYSREAARLRAELKKYDNPADSTLKCHIRELNHDRNKKSKLDSAVIGALVYADDMNVPVLAMDDPAVMNTVMKIENAFGSLYSINRKSLAEGGRGMGIGRYPEDVYDGVGMTGANPWFICTSWFGRYYYKLAEHYLREGKMDIHPSQAAFFQHLLGDMQLKVPSATVEKKSPLFSAILNSLMRKGDDYAEWILAHIPADGSMSEQIQRDTGKPQGARDLGWSYVEMVNLAEERRGLRESLRNHLHEMAGQRRVTEF